MNERLIPLGKPTTLQVVDTGVKKLDASALIVEGVRASRPNRYQHIVPCLEIRYSTKDGRELRAVGTTSKLFGVSRFPTAGSTLYTIFSLSAMAIYVGSTNNLMRRLSSHRSHLINGIHRNRDLAAIYTQVGSDDLEIMFLQFDETSEDQLRDLEQEVLDAARSVNHLRVLNISGDTKVFGRGLVRSEIFKENLRRLLQKGVCCEGVTYQSITKAAMALGLSKSQVHRRINSDTVEFSNWHYIQTEE